MEYFFIFELFDVIFGSVLIIYSALIGAIIISFYRITIQQYLITNELTSISSKCFQLAKNSGTLNE